MKYIFTIGFMMLCFALPAQAETAASAAMAEECVSNIPGADVLGIDTTAYCKCVAERRSFHASDFSDSTTPEGKRKIIQSMMPCLDKHVKKPVFDMCQKANGESGKGMPTMNCGCFYDALIQSFTGSIAAADSPESITQEEKAQVAQQAMTSCLGQ